MAEAPVASDTVYDHPRREMLGGGAIAEQSGGLLAITERGREMLEAHRQDDVWLKPHRDCHPARWSIGGPTITHCSSCCPPPPLPPQTQERIAEIIRPAIQRNAERAAIEGESTRDLLLSGRFKRT
jgi:hypothetical protein